MDVKTKHKILVVLTIAGLAVLSLPFLQRENFFSSASGLDKVPPFPDQSVQLTTPVPVNKSKPKTAALMQQNPLAVASTTWVIQVGNFTEKANALRLVNQLRNNGFRAFTKQSAETIRVYIGPEHEQANALALANTLVTELHIHGIIKTYKPLSM